MRRRPVGVSDLTFSEVALGTWALSGASKGRPLDGEAFDATVAAALEAGVTTFDVSPLWAGGEAESRLGNALGDTGRDEVEIIGRGGVRVQPGGEVELSHDQEALIGDCEGSLRRLGTDRIDLWLLQGLPADPGDDAWRYAVETLRRDGKIGYWGVSAGDPDTARRALMAGASAVCLPFNLVANDALDTLESELVVYKAGVLARSPLAYGLLALQWLETQRFPEGDHRRERWAEKDLRVRVRQTKRVRFLAKGRVGSPAEAAVRWVLTHPEVASALTGPVNARQMRDLARAGQGPTPHLPDEDLDRLDEVLVEAGLSSRAR